MNFHLITFGYGFGCQVGTFDIFSCQHIILSWVIIKKNQVWRSETHSRGDGGYHYRCVKNGETVEDISFRSPIVHHG